MADEKKVGLNLVQMETLFNRQLLEVQNTAVKLFNGMATMGKTMQELKAENEALKKVIASKHGTDDAELVEAESSKNEND